MKEIKKLIVKKLRETANPEAQTQMLGELILFELQRIPKPESLINTPLFHNLGSLINYILNAEISAMENKVHSVEKELKAKQAVLTSLQEKLSREKTSLGIDSDNIARMERLIAAIDKIEALVKNFPELQGNGEALQNKLAIMENLSSQIPDLSQLHHEAEEKVLQLRGEILRIQKIQTEAKEVMRGKQNEGV
ncbi:MAG TPA: hypothetical protein ENN84_03255 [Candidatus Marinimicrobia bacterium]|nr:hypothetical protein [Candidatus Neomarinimicrobiota bacterium]